MYQSSDIKNGLKIEIQGAPYEVVSFQHVNPGKGSSFTRTKLRNLIDGRQLEVTYKSNEKLTPADVASKKFQCLYPEGDAWVFMDNENYEQVSISKASLKENVYYLTENLEVDIVIFNGNPVGVELPNFVVLQVVEVEPAVKGDTATGASKVAKVSTGLTLNVPLYIKDQEKIRVDTRTGKFVERAK